MNAQTLVEFVCRSAGHHPVVLDATGRTLDEVALCNGADAIGAALAARGVEPGDVVACALPPGAELVAALIGTAAIRAVLAPLAPPATGWNDDALHAIGARILIVPAATGDGHGSGLETAVVNLAFDEETVALINGEPVFESHDRCPEPTDGALMTADGTRLSHAMLVRLAGARGLAALLELLTVCVRPLRRAA